MSHEHSALPTPHSAFRQVWRAVASVRVAVVLLILIAVASTVGIVLTQPESFNASTYLERRLDARAEHGMKPAEFVALARAAGILRGDRAVGELAERVGEGTLREEDWQGFAGMMANRLRSEEMGDACLRLSYVDSFGRVLGPVMIFLRLHALFTSAWFRIVCGLLLLNLVACSVERLPGQWRMAFGLRPSEDPGWYRRRATHAEAVVERGGADAVDAALRKAGFRTHRTEGAQGTRVEASRGWLGGLGRLGAQVVHLGVILIAMGGFVSGCLSFRHVQLLARGEVVAVPDVSYRISLASDLRDLRVGLDGLMAFNVRAERTEAQRAAEAPDWRENPGEPARNAVFRMSLRRFEFRSDARGKPEYYGAHVTLLDMQPETDAVIEVNRPLIYRGFHVYQQSYQPDYRGITSVSFIVAKVQRGTAGLPSRELPSHGEETPVEVLQQISLAVPPDTPVQVPGTDLTIHILRYFPHCRIGVEETPSGRRIVGENLSDEPVNPAVQVRLTVAGGAPRDRWVMLPLRPGEPRPFSTVDQGSYRIMATDFAPDYATWLTFKTHPVMFPVWLGCGLMMLGIVLCFYCNHERVWALVRPLDGGRAEVFLAGDSFKWRERFRERFEAIVNAIG